MTLKYKKTKRCSYTPKLVVYVHLFQRIKEIYEQLFVTMKEWGNSRALFCLARLLIDMLIKQKKQAKALMVI